MSLKVINDLGDDEVQANLIPQMETWYGEVRLLLPNLLKDLQVYFVAQDDELIMEDFGVGGYAYSPEIMSLGFALDFTDKTEQIRQLRSTIYHEGLHISQGYTGSGEQTPLVECLVYEGLATVFEREYAGIHQPYGNYPDNNEKLQEWFHAISKVKTPWEYEDYAKWGFEDAQTGEKWRLYKTGTWLVDNVLKNNIDISLLDLTKMSARHILKLKR